MRQTAIFFSMPCCSRRCLVALALLLLVQPRLVESAEWTVVLPEAYQSDEGLRVALEDLCLTGRECDATFVVMTKWATRKGNTRDPTLKEIFP